MNQESSLEEEATTSYEDLEAVQEAVQEEESDKTQAQMTKIQML